MSNNIKSKDARQLIERNPVHTVGGTYGERRLNNVQGNIAPKAASISRPVDQFSKSKQSNKLAAFNPNATFKAARKFSVDTPYKRPLHDRVERGTAPVVEGEIRAPSDKAIINFLDKLLDDPRLHCQRSVQKASGTIRPRPQRPLQKA